METVKNALDFSDFPRIDLMVAGAVMLFLLSFPLLPHSSFAMATMIQFLMFSLYGMGWNTIGGYGGQVDLGKAQYVGIGAYTTAVLLIRWDIPFWFSMPIGVCLSVAWSFIIGYPLFRLKGHYFAIATIATSLVLKDLFEVWGFVGAARGLEISPIKYQPPDFWRLIFREDIYYFYILLGFFLMGIIYINWFRKSRLGYQLRSIKDNEEVARSLGINVRWSKGQNLCDCHRIRERGRFISCLLHQKYRTGRHHESVHFDPDRLDGHAGRRGIALGSDHRRRDSDSPQKLSQGMAGSDRGTRGYRSDYLCPDHHERFGL